MRAWTELINWFRYEYPFVLLILTVAGMVIAAVLITRAIVLWHRKGHIEKNLPEHMAAEIEKRNAIIAEKNTTIARQDYTIEIQRVALRGVLSAASGAMGEHAQPPRATLRRVRNG